MNQFIQFLYILYYTGIKMMDVDEAQEVIDSKCSPDGDGKK